MLKKARWRRNKRVRRNIRRRFQMKLSAIPEKPIHDETSTVGTTPSEASWASSNSLSMFDTVSFVSKHNMTSVVSVCSHQNCGSAIGSVSSTMPLDTADDDVASVCSHQTCGSAIGSVSSTIPLDTFDLAEQHKPYCARALFHSPKTKPAASSKVGRALGVQLRMGPRRTKPAPAPLTRKMVVQALRGELGSKKLRRGTNLQARGAFCFRSNRNLIQ
jgi:hypothetical protein